MTPIDNSVDLFHSVNGAVVAMDNLKKSWFSQWRDRKWKHPMCQ